MEQKLRICKRMVCWVAEDSFNLYSNKIYVPYLKTLSHIQACLENK
jgi:hypothetical protein